MTIRVICSRIFSAVKAIIFGQYLLSYNFQEKLGIDRNYYQIAATESVYNRRGVSKTLKPYAQTNNHISPSYNIIFHYFVNAKIRCFEFFFKKNREIE